MNKRLAGMVAGVVLASVTASGAADPPAGPLAELLGRLDSLERQVEALQASDGLPVFSAGEPIGVLARDAPDYHGVVSPSGYLFFVEKLTGAVGGMTVFFSGNGCTDQAYFDTRYFYKGETLLSQGAVFATDIGTAYYLPRGSEQQAGEFVSWWDRNAGACRDEAGSSSTLARMLPNDYSVTKVASGPYAVPIILGVP